MKVWFDQIKNIMDGTSKVYKYLQSPRFSIFVYANILLYTLAGVLFLLKVFNLI